MVKRHFGICAVRTEFVIKWDLCRTFSCLVATEPTGAYGRRRRKLEALESQGQQTHPRRRHRLLVTVFGVEDGSPTTGQTGI